MQVREIPQSRGQLRQVVVGYIQRLELCQGPYFFREVHDAIVLCRAEGKQNGREGALMILHAVVI